MRFFEFLRPDKSPQNARMPKRLNTLKRKKRQPTHTPHPHNKIHPEVPTNTPRSFANTTIAHSKFPMCIDAKFPHTPTKHPEVSQCAKIRGFGLSKTTLQVSTHPTKHPEVSQCAKIQGLGLSKTTLQVSFYS